MNELTNKQFTHLKIHTQYSICEGALKTSDLAKYCKTNKIRAVGLCDSNNLCGALEFSEFVAKSKTQPIIGTQINIEYKGLSGKIPLFAKDLEGYKNLIKLSSKSFLEIKENLATFSFLGLASIKTTDFFPSITRKYLRKDASAASKLILVFSQLFLARNCLINLFLSTN